MRNIYILFFFIFWSNRIVCQNAFYNAQFVQDLNRSIVRIFANSDTITLGKDALSQLHYFTQSQRSQNNFKKLSAFIQDPIAYAATDNSTIIDFTLISKTLSAYYSASNNPLLYPVQTSEFIGAPAFIPLFTTLPSIIGSLSGIGSMQQTDFYDAVSQYITKEVKKSITQTYIDGFTATFGKVGEFQVLFPETFEYLKNKNPLEYPGFGNNEKEVYNRDLRNILKHTINLLEKEPVFFAATNCLYLDYDKVKNIKAGNYYPYLKVSYDISEKLSNKFHPAEIISYLDQQYFNLTGSEAVNTVFGDLGKLFHGLNILQTSLRDTAHINSGPKDVWISFEKLKQLRDPLLMNYFISLLYLEDKAFFKVAFDDLRRFNVGAPLDPYIRKYLVPIQELLTRMQTIINDTKVEDKQYTIYMQYMLDLARQASVTYMSGTSLFNSDQLFVAQKTLNILKSIHEKDYNNITGNFALLLDKLISKSLDPTQLQNISYLKLGEQFGKYSSFMVDIVNTKSADDLKTVIEKHMAPSNSFLKKKQSAFSIGLAANPGIYGGSETLKGDVQEIKTSKKSAFNFGITVPVGIDISRAGRKSTDGNTRYSAFITEDKVNYYTGHTWGINLQILDLAAIVNYRLSNDSSDKLPNDVKFYHLFSPGISFNWGAFKNNALNIGLGYQWTPRLRKITISGNEYNAHSSRVFLRLAWDLPLLHIYRKKDHL